MLEKPLVNAKIESVTSSHLKRREAVVGSPVVNWIPQFGTLVLPQIANQLRTYIVQTTYTLIFIFNTGSITVLFETFRLYVVCVVVVVAYAKLWLR